MGLSMCPDVPAACYTPDGSCLLPVVGWACEWRREQAAEEQVRGEIDHEYQEQESDEKVCGSGAVGAMEEGIFDGEIKVLVWGDEARGDQDGHEDGGLELPAAAIVA